MFKKALLPLFIVAALSGCNDGTADGTSQAALTESLGKMTTKIPIQEKQTQFADDVSLLQKNFTMDQLQTDLNGKNAEQIMQVAADLRSKLEAEQQQKADAEAAQQALIAEQAKASAIASIQSELKELGEKLNAENYKKLIKVDNAKFTTVKNEVTGEFDPIISLAVTNNGDRVLYSVTLDGSLVAPNVATPVYAGPLELEVEEGLKAGESQDLQIKPTLISEWRSVTAPEGSVLTLKVKDIKDKTGESLVNGLSFTEEDGLQFKELMQQLMALDPDGFRAQAESIPSVPANVAGAVLSAVEAAKTEAAPVSVTEQAEAEATPEAAVGDQAPEAAADEPVATIEEVEALEAAPAAVEPAPVLLPETEVKAATKAELAPAPAQEEVKADDSAPEFGKIQAPDEAADPAAEPAPVAAPTVAPTKNF
jgi:type II secretory pathway pseudopilin PulG